MTSPIFTLLAKYMDDLQVKTSPIFTLLDSLQVEIAPSTPFWPSTCTTSRQMSPIYALLAR
jgi:hypothetical protein